MLVSLLFLVLVFFIYSVSKILKSRKRSSRDKWAHNPGLSPIPGPKGLPFLGSALDLPDNNTWEKISEWGGVYGSIFQTKIAGSNHIWILNQQHAHQLLSIRAANYSHRPKIPGLIIDNRTSTNYFPLMSCNSLWKRQRKFAQFLMKDAEVNNYYLWPEKESLLLCHELLNDPSHYSDHFETYVCRVICHLAWGHAEPYEEVKQRARDLLFAISPAGSIANKLPFLMSLPKCISICKAREQQRMAKEERFLRYMLNIVRGDISEKSSTSSWLRLYLENSEKHGLRDETEASQAIGMHAIAGALTSASTMIAFVMAACFYPEHFSILYEEIDRVAGNRPPTSKDMPNMPVLRAFIRELFRWRPPVAMGIPHVVDKDDAYNSLHIPSGSILHPVEWIIGRDPDIFPEPDQFNPNRWLDPKFKTYKEPLTIYPTIINCTQFGFGRRACQGQKIAHHTLFCGIGAIAWLFTFRRDKDGIESEKVKNMEDPKDQFCDIEKNMNSECLTLRHSMQSVETAKKTPVNVQIESNVTGQCSDPESCSRLGSNQALTPLDSVGSNYLESIEDEKKNCRKSSLLDRDRALLPGESYRLISGKELSRMVSISETRAASKTPPVSPIKRSRSIGGAIARKLLAIWSALLGRTNTMNREVCRHWPSPSGDTIQKGQSHIKNATLNAASNCPSSSATKIQNSISTNNHGDKSASDPTLRISNLIISKLLPIPAIIQLRSQARADLVRSLCLLNFSQTGEVSQHQGKHQDMRQSSSEI